MNFRIMLTIVMLSCIAFAAPAAAQQTATPTDTPTNASAPDGAPSDAVLVVDEDVVVTDYRYADGQMIIEFWSAEYKIVTIAPSPDAGSESGSIQFREAVVDGSRTTTVTVSSAGGVTLWTDDSLQKERFHYLRKPSSFLITGPYDGSDVRDAGLGGALGVVIAVLYEAVAAKVGSAQRGERLA